MKKKDLIDRIMDIDINQDESIKLYESIKERVKKKVEKESSGSLSKTGVCCVIIAEIEHLKEKNPPQIVFDFSAIMISLATIGFAVCSLIVSISGLQNIQNTKTLMCDIFLISLLFLISVGILILIIIYYLFFYKNNLKKSEYASHIKVAAEELLEAYKKEEFSDEVVNEQLDEIKNPKEELSKVSTK